MSASAAGSGGNTAAASGPPTFTRVWSEVLEKKGCSGQYCHGSGQGGLKFASQAEAYSALVGVAAAGPKCMSSGIQRVKPSDSANSLLVEKLSKATPVCGDIMPIGTKLDPACLSMNPSVCNTQAEVTLVKQWIDAGAKND
jgi:predicted CxxxxCH...CXXCH cytochrome family protein